ncbi:tail fiber domain-containing protein [Verrucomicrobiales bacterium]|nr:tail fiber domain-containing protein [Verrucomicrobiales bacterium]
MLTPPAPKSSFLVSPGRLTALILTLVLTPWLSDRALAADPPGILNHQGQIAVDGTNHEGPGFFKFSLVKDVGGTEAILWHHDGTALGTAEPAGEVEVTVSEGHYAVLLGDTDAAMTAIPVTVFSDNDNVSLRIWFSTTSGSGFEQLAPDRRVASVGYALSAHSVMGGGSLLSGGNLTLPATTDTTGILYSGSDTLLHTFGTNNFFAGVNAGNLTMTGFGNTASGGSALGNNTTGSANTASGRDALRDNTEGDNNTAYGRSALQSNISGNDNTASGRDALRDNTTGENNTAYGRSALQSNISGANNTASGRDALLTNTTGENNTAYGRSALRGNETGSSNTATGFGALLLNENGANNTANGVSALTSNISGADNTASGRDALRDNTTGENNTAYGRSALQSNISGAYNTASGRDALRDNTTGVNNTAYGRDALRDNTTGVNNTAYGAGAGSLTTGSNNIVIGHPGVAAEVSTTRIGYSSDRAFIAGIRGATTGLADAVTVMVDSEGQLGTVLSSRRYKQNIRPMKDFGVSERISQLRPVTFEYKQAQNGDEHPVQFGLIAEEVAKVFPELAVFNKDGQPETVKYHLLAPMLLNEMQDERKRHDQQLLERDREIEELRAELKAERKSVEQRLRKLEEMARD